MSLRLLQKQLGQESEERQRQLGHAPAARGRGRGSWLGSKPRSGIGRTATGTKSAGNTADSIPEEAEEESPVVGFYRGKGKGGKSAGRGSAGRGSSSFVSDLADNDGEKPSTTPAKSQRPAEPAVAPTQEDEASVQGLEEVLASSSLTRHAATATKWCNETGAANLEEIAESLDDFVKALSLKPLERKRLEKALKAAGGSGEAESAEVQAARAAALAAERARAEAMEELSSAVAAGGDEARLSAAIEAAAAAGVHEDECAEAKALLDQLQARKKDAASSVQGLAEVLTACSLTRHAAAATKWCDEWGAANLEEIAESLDDFVKGVGLKPLERKRFEKALSAATGGAAAVKTESAEAQAARAAEEQLQREKAEALEEVSSALAAQGDDEKLSEAIERAEKVCGDSDVIAEAKEELERRKAKAEAERERREASEALQSAIDDDEKDFKPRVVVIEDLRKALLWAEEVGCDDALIERAKEELAEREAVAQARADAATEVQTALENSDLEPLRDALKQLQEVGGDSDLVEQASAEVAKREAAAQRAQERAHAESVLQSAIADKDIETIERALQQAESAEASKTLMAEARHTLDELHSKQKAEQERREAAEALQSAMEEHVIADLREALQWAEEAGCDDALIAKAKAELAQREAVEQAVADVQAALQKSDLEPLRDALKTLQEVDGESKLAEEASEELTKREVAAQKAQERADAESMLQSAVAGEDVEMLERALGQAKKAAASKELMAEARKMLDELQSRSRKAEQQKREATEALQSAMEESVIEDLKEALQWAEEAACDGAVLEQAKAELAIREEAILKIDTVLAGDVIGSAPLQSIVDEFRDVRVDKKALESEKAARHRGEMDLSTAREEVGSQGLREALDKTESLKIERDEVMKEFSKRTQAESAISSALTGGTLGSVVLQEALNQIGDANVSKTQIETEIERRLAAEATIETAMDEIGSEALEAALQDVAGISVDNESINKELKVRQQAEQNIKNALDADGTDELEKVLLEVEVDQISVDTQPAYDELANRKAQQAHREEAEHVIAEAMNSDQVGSAILEEALQRVKDIDVDMSVIQAELDKRKDAERKLIDALADTALGCTVLQAALHHVREVSVDKEAVEEECQRRQDAEHVITETLEVGQLGSAVLQAALQRVAGVKIDTSAFQAELDLRIDAEQTLERALADTTQGSAQLQAALEEVQDVAVERAAAEEELEKRRKAEKADQERQEEAEQQRRQAALALQLAMHDDKIESLREALRHAEEVGCEPADIEGAKAELAEREAAEQARAEAETKLAEERKAATTTLQAALKKGDVEPIREALRNVEEIGGDRATIDRAKKELAKREAAAQKAQARADAEATLQRAIADGDMEVLESSLPQAEKAGASKKLVGDAKRALVDLRGKQQKRQEAEQKLIAAAGGDSTDVLQSAIDEAVAAGVGESALNEARASLESKKKVADAAVQRKEAAAALQAALKKTDLEPIMEAMKKLEEIGGDSALIERAKKELTKREAAAQKAQARADAESMLQSAIADEDIEKVEQALPQAEKSGVAKKILTDAKRALTELQSKRRQRQKAEQRLMAAAGGDDLGAFQSALDDAVAVGVCEAALQEARARWEPKQEEEKRLAEEAREAAQRKAEEERLAEEAAARAAEEERIAAEKKAAEDQQAAEEAALRAREDATIALQEAMQGDEIASLQEAIESAKSAGVDEGLMEEAVAAAQEMQEAQGRADAAAALGAAAVGTNRVALREAIARAESVGISGSTLERAKSSLSDLEASSQEVSSPSRAISSPLSLTDDEVQELLVELQDAAEARDGGRLGPLLAKAEKAGVDPQDLAVAKRVNFQLQKEKRENAKKDKIRKEAAQILAEAVAESDMEALREALARAQEVGLTEGELEDAQWRLAELEDAEKRKLQQFALQDAEYAISQNDVEAATLALEEAVAEGADPADVARVEKELAALRERLDPEGEARRRRLEKRRSKEADKKWNFSGKSKNAPQVNDRLREHEEELEKRRMLAFKNRRFRNAAEDEGEEAAEKEVRKMRHEVNQEKGYVALPKPSAAPQKGFHYLPASKEEKEAPRKLTLKAHLEMGAGIDLHACWWGMTVDSIDDEPGQPGLRLQDTIVDVNGTSLCELESEDCEQRFADLFGDGSVVTVEPHVQATGVLTADSIDHGSLTGDLERFAADWSVEVRFEEISTNCLRVITEGPQSAVKAAKPELEGLMKFYAGV